MSPPPQPSFAIALPPQHFIGNRWIAPETGETLPDDRPVRRFAVRSDRRGNGTGRDEPLGRRSARATAPGDGSPRWTRAGSWPGFAHAILDHADELAQIEARDCGKPMKQASADAIACARYFEFYAGACDKLHGETIPYPPAIRCSRGASRTV